MPRLWQSAVVALAAIWIFSAQAQQAVQQPYQEYDKQLRSAEQVGALTSELFGEAINVYDQATHFRQTDITLPGSNALPVTLTRRFNIRPIPSFGQDPEIYGGAGDWNIDVPFISGVFDADYGWIRRGNTKIPRCSANFVPYTEAPFNISDIWSGYTVNLPGEGSRSLIGDPPQEFRPDGRQSTSWSWSTNALDAISCTPMIAGYEGEGFILQTKEGIKYTFNVGTQRSVGQMMVDSATGYAKTRIEVYLLASRIEDRFGNSVSISYNSNGHPTAITGSDGRQITLSYSSNRLHSASANGRTWTYVYSGSALQKVTQPDGATWVFQHLDDTRVSYENWTEDPGVGCGGVAPLREKMYRLRITHPSGAVGTFRFDHQRHYRAGVPATYCYAMPAGEGLLRHVLGVPYFSDLLSLTEKTIEGPGLAQMRWTYGDYGDYQPMWEGAITPCTSCPQSKVVRITQPDGSWIEETYGVVFEHNEGRLLGRKVMAASGVALETEELSYLSNSDAVGMPFPDRYGWSWGGFDGTSTLVRPLKERKVVRDGVTMTWRANTFDHFAQPINVTRSSSQGVSRTDSTTYYNNTAIWILGKVASQRNDNTGLIEVQTTYNAQGLPSERRRFGQLVQTLSYHADGSVAGFGDGRGNTTSLNNWKRGVPQSIGFADGAGVSASADDNGWIRSVTNEAGYVTSYQYDSMGRQTSRAFAGGDSVAWNPTTQVFERVDAVEHGLAAGHWRLTTTTGSRSKVSWFDAMWRPSLTLEQDSTNAAGTARYQRFSYNHAGRPVFQSYPAAISTPTTGVWSEFDALGRLTSSSVDSELGLLTTVTEYLPGMRVRTTNPRGQQTLTEHRVYDTPGYDMAVTMQHPGGAYTDIARDIFGKATSIKRRNADSSVAVTRSYIYNAQQQLCKTIEPETGATAMGYDAAGNLAWSAAGLALTGTNDCDAAASQASGRRIDRTYDARNRLKQLIFADGKGNQTWIYNIAGLPIQITTQNPDNRQVINTYSYSLRGQMVSETQQQTGTGIWSMGYGYDANGAVATLQYPSGMQVSLAPNALGQPTRAGSYATAVSYHPNGALRSFSYGNGITHSMYQNARGLPTRMIDAGALDNSIAYDPNGNVANIVDAVEPIKSRQMQYDALDRLIQANSTSFGGDGAYHYTYDVLDNLRSAKLGGVKQHSYWYDSRNRMTTVNRDDGSAIIGLAYDAQGNLAIKNGEAFNFDLGNRLRDVGGRESYAYDAHGRRVGAYNVQGDILSFYGNDGTLRRQHNKRTGTEVEYIALGSHLIAQIQTPVALPTPVLTGPATVATGSYTLSWTSVSNANRYDLRMSNDGGQTWSTAYAGAASTHAVSGAPRGTRHYQVRACQGTGCGAWSTSIAVAHVPVPTSAPSLNLPAVGLNGNIVISWAAVVDAATYVIEEQAGSGAWTSIHAAASLQVSLTARAAGTYSYRGRACNASGCGPDSSTHPVTVIYPSGTAPTVTAPSSSYSGAFTVDWTAVAGSIRYEPQERQGTAAWSSLASTTGTSLAIAGKSTGNYSYQVRVCNSAGCGPWSNTVTTGVLLPPASAPAITLEASSTTGSYPVGWTSVAGAVEYRLEERAGNESWQRIQAEAATLRNISGKTTGTWSYRVQACNAAGCGAWSSSKSISVLLVPTTPTVATPATSSSGVWTVSWTAAATATSYQLEERAGTSAWAIIHDGASTSKSISEKATSAYGYRVRACNSSGCGSYSPVVETIVTRPPSSAPNLNAPPINTNGSFTLSWSAVIAATQYDLEELVSGAWIQVPSTGISHAINGRGNGSYSFRVRACNGGGCTGYSASTTTTVLLPPQSAPNLSVPVTAPGAYTVSWSMVSGATSSSLQQNINGGGWAGAGSHTGTGASFSPSQSGTYAYRVQACNSSGCGPWSATGSVNVIRAPAAPAITYAYQHWYYAGPHNSEFAACSVKWTASSGADRYELHAEQNGTIYGQMYSGPLNEIAGTGYSIQYCASPYVVRACNAAGCSGWSAPFWATIERDEPPANPGDPPL
ncbi:RHS repeat protein [Stenotrophomonas maltophilia]|nr:RHS repeat protein [Stenotrophomonas maltophilia]